MNIVGYIWHAMYLGAFIALDVTNGPIADELTKLTRSAEEAVVAIEIMRRARPGDRVYPALRWLREQRQKES